MIRYFVGVPGSGKTTIAAKLLKSQLKRKFFKKSKFSYDYLFANYENSLSNFVDVQDLASYILPENSYLQIDEGGIEFNSRQFKSLSHNIIEYFKLLRHYGVDADLFSQTWDDVDKQLRDLASEIWLIRRIGPISFARCVYKRVGIDETTHQLQYQHYWRSVLFQLLPFQPKQFIFCFRPLYYKYFDSFSKPILRDILPGEHKTVMSYMNIK